MAYTRTRSSKSAYSPVGDLYWLQTNDNPTPNYKALVASGVLFSKDYYHAEYRSAGPVNNQNTGYHVNRITGGVPPVIDLGNVLVAVSRKLVTDINTWNYGQIPWLAQTIYAKCGSTTPSNPSAYDLSLKHTQLSADLNTGIASILVSAAELPKTVRMINKALMLLRNPLINAKNKLRLTRVQLRTPQGRKALLDMAEQDWLEGRYGWRPFIYDVMSWVEASKSKYSERRTVKGQVTSVSPAPFVETYSQTSVGCPPVTLTTKWQIDYIASAGQTADFGVNLSQFARTWGALDVAGTAWELVKFSFILDWFFNLGDSLKALQVYALIDERVGWNKFSTVGTVKQTYTYPALGTYGDRQVDSLVNEVKTPILEQVKITQRNAVTSFMPSLGFSMNVDCAKTLDLLALLHQLVEGRR